MCTSLRTNTGTESVRPTGPLWYFTAMDEERIKRLLAERKGFSYVPGTPEECLAMVWPLTCEAWASDPKFDPNAPLRRDINRLIRREDDV